MRLSRALGSVVSELQHFAPGRIRWKIVAPFLVLTLIVAALGTFLATRSTTSYLGDRFDNQLTAAANSAADAVVSREQAHLETLRSVSFTIGVPQSVEARDTQRLRSLVEPTLANSNQEIVRVLDSRGGDLLSLSRDTNDASYTQIDPDPALWNLPAVKTVVSGGDSSGDKSAQLVPSANGTILYTVGPILDGSRLVGVVLVGSNVDDLLSTMKQSIFADVTFFDLNGTVVASTLPGVHEGARLKRRDSGTGVTGLAGVRQTSSFGGRDYAMLFGDLVIRNERIGAFAVALPSSFISDASVSTRNLMIAVFGTASIAVLLIGLIIARGVTKPLLALVQSARSVASGDLSVRAPVKSRDEVGMLAGSFNVMTDRLANQHLQTIRALTSAIDARDPYTAGHSVRVGQLSVEIGRQLELTKRDLQFLEVGGYLHDIGKIGIRDHILLKQGPLTVAERSLIEDHPRIGLGIIKHVDLPAEVLEVVGGHHEKLDGSGYPDGLADQNIGLYARIAAVSDIFDAITTERPYKPAFTPEEAVQMLRRETLAGHLDERVVDGLIRSLSIWQRRLAREKSLRGFLLEDITPEVPVPAPRRARR